MIYLGVALLVWVYGFYVTDTDESVEDVLKTLGASFVAALTWPITLLVIWKMSQAEKRAKK